MTETQRQKKEKGTKIAPKSVSVKNQMQITKFNEAIPTEVNYFVKRVILNRKEIQILLSNSINSLDPNILTDSYRIGSILKSKKNNIEKSLIKNPSI
ncbi:MAG: hypothetical protein JKY69_03590 [Flavobacteriaceae bacterium]|nr:hypothetical protein [Flavobacteriaceae bacterium]MBL4905794.1 hypothetical protein [Flavobacteriaceae bacterium]